MIDKDAVAVGDSLAWKTRPPHRTVAYGLVVEVGEDAVRVQKDMGHSHGRYWIPWDRVIRHEPGRAMADSKARA